MPPSQTFIPFAVIMLVIALIVSIRKKHIGPLAEMGLYISSVLIIELAKFLFSQYYTHWTMTLLLPFVIGLVALYVAHRIVKKLDFKY